MVLSETKHVPMSLTELLNRIVRKGGIEVVRYRPTWSYIARRQRLFESINIQTVFDVGANKGQYAQSLRAMGFMGKMISFEPLAGPFSVLKKKASRDPNWACYNFALGDVDAQSSINVAGNSESSSLVPMLPAHEKCAPESKYVTTQAIQVKTLDSFLSGSSQPKNEWFLKIDTQGFEKQVLSGAQDSLDSINTVQIEISLTPLYQGGLLLEEACAILAAKGYKVVSLEPGFTDETTGKQLQVDGIFHRSIN